MSRISFSGARTGRRARNSGNGLVKQFEWAMGDRKRLVFPVVDESLVLLAKPFHPVLNKSIALPRSSGQGVYTVDKIRCTHPYAQTSNEEGYKLAKTGEICVFCQAAKYENRRLWEVINSQYGDAFREMTKEQKKEIFQALEIEKTVDPSYYTETLADGSKQNSTFLDIFILALDLHVDPQGTVLMDPAVDANGQVIPNVTVPRYDVVLMPASKARLAKFKEAVENSLMSGTIPRTMLHPFIENEGTDMEEEVLIGYVDFLVSFPVKADKMISGKDMSVVPMAHGASVVTPQFIQKFEQQSDAVVSEAEKMFDRLFVNLQVHTVADGKEMFNFEGDYFAELEQTYRRQEAYLNDQGETIKSDIEADASMLETVITNYEKYNAPNDAVQAEPLPQAPVAQPQAQVAQPLPQAPVAQPQPQVAQPLPQAPVAQPQAQVAQPLPQAPVTQPQPQVAQPLPQAPVAQPQPQVAQPLPQAPVAQPQPQAVGVAAQPDLAVPRLDDSVFDV